MGSSVGADFGSDGAGTAVGLQPPAQRARYDDMQGASAATGVATVNGLTQHPCPPTPGVDALTVIGLRDRGLGEGRRAGTLDPLPGAPIRGGPFIARATTGTAQARHAASGSVHDEKKLPSGHQGTEKKRVRGF